MVMATAKVTIKRDSGYADSMRQYHIYLDGRSIGKVKSAGKLTCFYLPVTTTKEVISNAETNSRVRKKQY